MIEKLKIWFRKKAINCDRNCKNCKYGKYRPLDVMGNSEQMIETGIIRCEIDNHYIKV